MTIITLGPVLIHLVQALGCLCMRLFDIGRVLYNRHVVYLFHMAYNVKGIEEN